MDPPAKRGDGERTGQGRGSGAIAARRELSPSGKKGGEFPSSFVDRSAARGSNFTGNFSPRFDFRYSWALPSQKRFTERAPEDRSWSPRSGMTPSPSWQKPVAITAATTLLVALLSRLPDSYSATAVGFAFLAVTYALVLRTDDRERIARFGLSFAGLFDPEPLSFARIARDVGRALLWALGTASLCLPAFWIGFLWWW